MVKYTKYALPAVLGAAMLLSSCADDPVQKISYPIPNSLKDKVDYTQYENLKEAASPNVKMAGIIPGKEIVDGGTSKIIATKNFVEVEMSDFTHASSVKKDGTTSFTDLKSFIKAAGKGGFSIYGGPIMSNNNVNAEYLSKVIQNKVDPNSEPFYETKEVERHCIMIDTKDKAFQAWDTQFWIVTKDGFKNGDSFEFSAEVKADNAVNIGASTHSLECFYVDWQANFTVPFTSKWQKVSFEGTFKVDGGSLAMDLNTFEKANVYYFDNVSFKVNGKEQISNGDFETGTEHEQFRRICHYTGAADGHDNEPRKPVAIITTKGMEDVEVPAGPYTIYKDVLVNGDLEGSDFSAFSAKIYPAADPAILSASLVAATDGVDGTKCIKLDVPAKVTNPWDSQFWINLPEGADAGSTVRVEFDYKAASDARVSVQTHRAPGDYLGGGYGLTDVSFTTTWQHYSGDYSVQAEAKSIAFQLNEVDFANTYYWDNFKVSIPKDTLIGGTPLTPEEKKDTLSKYLDSYIALLMGAAPEISVWDAVVDPLPAADPAAVEFDWGSLLGDDYVGIVTKAAKANYAGENASDLKFFVAVNTDLDGDKVSAVTSKIADFEKAGATIDGINAIVTIDLSKGKDGVDKVISALKSSGKLVRITLTGFSEPLGENFSEAANIVNYLAQKFTTDIDKPYGFAIGNLNATVWDSKFERGEIYKGLVLGLKGQGYSK